MGDLPDGAKKIKKRRIGPGYCWVETLEVDAELTRHGVRWLRVAGGFGGKGDREDWIVDASSVAVSVHDYNWNGERFGEDLGSTIEEAMDTTLRNELVSLPSKITKASDVLADLVQMYRLFTDAERSSESREGPETDSLGQPV